MRRFHGGERFPMLLDERGVPFFWATIWTTVRGRNAGRAFNSTRNMLAELKTLLRWEKHHGRDLEVEFRSGRFLSEPDAQSIHDFAAQKVGRSGATRTASDSAALIPEARFAPVTNRAPVSKQVLYNRLTTIADYVGFLAQTLTAHRNDRELTAAIDRMVKRIRHKRPEKPGERNSENPDRRNPTPAVVAEFVAVTSEGHPENPFRRGSTQRRNELMIRLLFETGVRLGEVLSLRLNAIETGDEPYVSVQRTHDDVHDSRTYQPVAKTMERELPISDELAAMIQRYCLEDRARTPGAKRHPYLLVTHRKGDTCGQPLSASAVSNRVFVAMQRVRREFAEIHPHSFRHHDNYRFSKAIDEHNRKARPDEDSEKQRIPEGREAQMRAHRNGHRSLKSAEGYNERHVRETTNTAVREMQQRQWDNARQAEEHDDA